MNTAFYIHGKNQDPLAPASPDGRLAVTYPRLGRHYDSVGAVRGSAAPHSTVTVSLDGRPALSVRCGRGGLWSAALPSPLPPGRHWISAAQGRHSDSAWFTINQTRLAPPSIEYPSDGTIPGKSDFLVSGRAEPGGVVTVRLPGAGCRTAVADADGNYAVRFSALTAPSNLTLTAVQRAAAGNMSPELKIQLAAR